MFPSCVGCSTILFFTGIQNKKLIIQSLSYAVITLNAVAFLLARRRTRYHCKFHPPENQTNLNAHGRRLFRSLMPSYNFPSIDAKNPFYCPSVPAAAYLDSLRRRLSRTGPYSKSTNNQYFLKSFARILDKALLSDDSDNDDDDDDTSAFLEPSSRINLSHRELEPSLETSEDHPLGFEYTIPTWEYEDIDDLSENPWVGIRGQPVPSNPPGLQNLKRKRTSFSDIRGPEKHAKSFQSVHDSSFDVSVKHEKLRYSELDIPRPRPYRKTIEPNAESTPHIKPEQKCNENDTVQLQFKLRIRALEGVQILGEFLT